MNAIRPVARTDETVTLRTADFDALLHAVEEAEDVVALLKAGAREEALGKVEARADHMSDDLVARLLDGEHPVAIWRIHRDLAPAALAEVSGLLPSDLADIEAGLRPPSVADYRALSVALGVAIDDLVTSGE